MKFTWNLKKNVNLADTEEDPNCAPRKMKEARAQKGINRKPEPEKLVLVAPSQGVMAASKWFGQVLLMKL